jgi:hypothetical protein
MTPEAKRLYEREYRARTREARRAQANAWYHKNRHRARDYDLRRQFGMSLLEFRLLVHQQGGLCRICCESMKPGAGTHVDHSHATGAVRGLLCSRCNHALGHLRDDPLLCEAAKEYLDNQPKENSYG